MKKLPLTIMSLVAQTPFSWPDGSMFLGQKSCTFYALDTRSGKIIAQYQQGGEEDRPDVPSEDLATLFSGNARSVILLARTTYSVTCFVPSGRNWRLSFSQFGGFVDPFSLKSSSSSSSEDRSLRPVGSIAASELLVYSSINRFLQVQDAHTLESMWLRRLPSIPVNFFELREPSDGERLGPVLARIPLARRLAFGAEGTNVDEVRITLGEEGGHLFVLPSDLFPFFAPSFADHRHPRLPGSLEEWKVDEEGISIEHVSSSCRPGRVDYPACLRGQHIAEVLRPTPLLGEGHKPVPHEAFAWPFSWKVLSTGLVLLVAYTYLARHGFRAREDARIRVPPRSGAESSPHPPGFEEISLSSAAAIYRALDADSSSSIPQSFIISDVVIGYGSHGTVVFKGSFGGRPVAVKRMLSQFFELAGHEVSLLRQSDHHPNVIRYYCLERTEKFTYIVLELCRASLADLFEGSQPLEDAALGRLRATPLSLLQQITRGLAHLHEMKLIHRDLKPQNILITQTDRVVISDFGLSKRLAEDQSSFLPTFQAGTLGWRAPECIASSEMQTLAQLDELVTPSALSAIKLSKSIDIFSLGCIFYYVLSQGVHPFGSRLGREANIVNNLPDLVALQNHPEARDLIERMIDPVPERRPDCKYVLAHPLFWDAQKQIAFIQDLSDKFETEDRKPFSEILERFERRRSVIFEGGPTWSRRLDTAVWEDLCAFRKYNGRSARDLLRAIRNKRNHFHELAPEIRRILGETPDKFVEYFRQRFPRLLIEAYRLVESTAIRNEHPFCSQYLCGA